MADSVLHNETKTFSDIYNISIDEYEDALINSLPFSVRTSKRFNEIGIATVADLLRVSPKTLMAIKGFGRSSLDEAETFCAELQAAKTAETGSVAKETISGNDINSFQKAAKANVDYIAFGDFSFADRLELCDEETACLQSYKKAFFDLGDDLAFDCISSPEKIIPIIEMFDDYLHEEKQYHEVRELLEGIPAMRMGNLAAGYINAFTIKENDRHLLQSFFIAETATIASVVACKSFGNDEKFILLKKFLKWCTFDLQKEIDQLFEALYANERVQTVIRLRARKQTLEQIGKVLGVTRERVRQIEAKAKRSFNRLHSRVRVISKISAERNGDTVLTFAEIEEYCGTNIEELLYLLKSFQSANYTYDSQLDVFIVGDDSLQSRVQNYLETLPDVIKTNQLSSILSAAKDEEDIPEEMLEKAIMDTYRVTGNVYHRIALSLAVIYTTILSKYYPSGIKVYDPEEIKEFRKRVTAEYSDVRLPANDRALTARITSICTLRGRGIYILKKKEYIPRELSDRMHKYIVKSENSIFLTNTLYSVFEDELVTLGVDNKYFLQGILRELFADEFIFSRDYISKDPDITSIYSTIVDFIKRSQYPISKAQIQLAFPGVTEIVINFAVSDPNILNYFGEYLHASRIFISEHEKEYLKELIERTISDENAHHSRNFYEAINLENPELLTRNAAMLSFSAFSILEYLFRDKYQFSRPYIAQNGADIGRPGERLHDLIYSADEFAVSDISEFSKENHFQIQSMLDYINSCNDQFLLVDVNTMMKIERIGITEDVAIDVDRIVFDEISETTPISHLPLWNRLPRIAVPWTNWLLYSVLNKWGRKVEVSTSSNQFRLSAPLVAPVGKMDISAYKDFDRSKASVMTKIDDLNNIDELLEDIIGDDIWEDSI